MYIELHARSAFSFLEGSSLPEDLIAICAAHHQPAMALLDRDGLYGAPRFHMAAKKAGLRAHIGAEVACELVPGTEYRVPSEDGLVSAASKEDVPPKMICHPERSESLPRASRGGPAF